MEFAEYFPVWDKLTPSQQQALAGAAALRTVKKGTVLHNGGTGCRLPASCGGCSTM